MSFALNIKTGRWELVYDPDDDDTPSTPPFSFAAEMLNNPPESVKVTLTTDDPQDEPQ